jgi:hypothetical protein
MLVFNLSSIYDAISRLDKRLEHIEKHLPGLEAPVEIAANVAGQNVRTYYQRELAEVAAAMHRLHERLDKLYVSPGAEVPGHKHEPFFSSEQILSLPDITSAAGSTTQSHLSL